MVKKDVIEKIGIENEKYIQMIACIIYTMHYIP